MATARGKKRDVLGKGLEVLLSSASRESGQDIVELNINEVEPNRSQPRRYFDSEAIRSLADSIKEHGVIQPIIVKKDGNTYKIVAGERRWRAARMAGLETISARIWELSDRQSLEIALVENVQRKDLNPVEEAEAYDRLSSDHGMTQEQIAKAVGKSRPAVANAIRLLELDEGVKQLLTEEKLTSGHARALLSITDKDKQLETAHKAAKLNMNVRDVEKLVKKVVEKGSRETENKSIKDTEIEDCLRDIAEKMQRVLGTKVRIDSSPSGNKGKIVIEYYSNEELERLTELILKKDKAI